MKTINKCFILFIFFLLIAITAGCSGIRDIKKDTIKEDMQKLRVNSEEDLNAIPPIIKVPISKKELRINEPPFYKNKLNISVSFNNVEFKKAMRSIARQLKVNIMFDYESLNNNNPSMVDTYQNTTKLTPPTYPGASATVDNKQKIEYKPKIEYFDRYISLDYKGPVKELFDYLATTTNYFYTFVGNSLVIKEIQTFKIIVPNYPGLLKEVGKSIESLGGQDISYDEITNNITFTANYSAFKNIESYTNDIRNNMALVKLRIIILNVTLSGDNNYGIDWSKITAGYRAQTIPTPFGVAATNSTSSTGTNTASTTGTATASTTTTATNPFSDGIGVITNSTGANIFIQSAKFTLSAFADFIQTYGKAQMLQNISVEALSGKEAELNSLTKTPYVSSVGVQSLNNNTSATTSAASTDTARNGISLKMTPSYSKAEGTLTIQLNVGIYGVIRMMTLSAGTLGTFQQPETTEKSVKTTLRMSPAQTAIIGGLIFEQKTDSTTGLPIDTYLTGTVNNTKSKEELIVLAKPQVTIFVPED